MKKKSKAKERCTGRGKDRKEKLAGFDPKYNPRNRSDMYDQDYLSKLTMEELRWLNQFMEEYANATLNHGKEPFHKTPEERSICWAINNHRNKDIYVRKRTIGKLSFIADLHDNVELLDFNPEQYTLMQEVIEQHEKMDEEVAAFKARIKKLKAASKS